MQKQLLLSLILLLTGLSQLSAQEKMPLYLGGQFSLRVLESGNSGQGNAVPNQKISFFDMFFSSYLMWEKHNGSARGIRLGIDYGNRERVIGITGNTGREYFVSAGFFNRLLLYSNTATLKFWLTPEVGIKYARATQEDNGSMNVLHSKNYGISSSMQGILAYSFSSRFRITAAWQGLNYDYLIVKREGQPGISYSHNLSLWLNPSAFTFGLEMRLRQ